jgi:integrase/recombinase XerD
MASAINLTPEQRDELFETIPFISWMPSRDVLIFALSHFQGLRACEIAQLRIDSMLGPRGEILDLIRIAPHMTKKSGARVLPLHPFVRDALADFLDAYPDAEWVAISPRHGRQMKAPTLRRAMQRIYERAGFGPCRSHCGRATCITEMANTANLNGANIGDVQFFAGHKRLETTASYISPTGRLGDLVRSLGGYKNGRTTNGRSGFQDARRTASYRAQALRVERQGGSGASGKPHLHRDGRRDEERLASRMELHRRARRKLRQTRPQRRDH